MNRSAQCPCIHSRASLIKQPHVDLTASQCVRAHRCVSFTLDEFALCTDGHCGIRGGAAGHSQDSCGKFWELDKRAKIIYEVSAAFVLIRFLQVNAACDATDLVAKLRADQNLYQVFLIL